MYAIKACEEWMYGSKPLVSGSDIGLGLWCCVVGWVDAGVLKDPGAFIVRVARSEHSQKTWVSFTALLWETERTLKVQLYSFLNSAVDGSEWPPLLFGRLTLQERTTQYQGRSGRFGEVRSADERAWRSERGPEARLCCIYFCLYG